MDEPRIKNASLDILAFWKANQFRYPILAMIARDILSIPVSTVASESAFSNGGRVLDPFRSSLKSETVEALVCTKDWLFANEGKLIEFSFLITFINLTSITIFNVIFFLCCRMLI